MRVSRHFESISAELHAAPAARALFARVQKMQHALSTFSNSSAVSFSKQSGCTVDQGRKQIFRLASFEGRGHTKRTNGSHYFRVHRMGSEYVIEFFDRGTPNLSTGFPEENLLAKLLSQSTNCLHEFPCASRTFPPVKACELVIVHEFAGAKPKQQCVEIGQKLLRHCLAAR